MNPLDQPHPLHLVADALFVAGLLCLSILIWWGVSVPLGYRRPRRALPYLVALAGGLAGLTLAAGLFWLGTSLVGYREVAGRELVARVRAEPAGVERIRLRVTVGGAERERGATEVLLPASRWALGGDLLRWEGVLRRWGARDRFRMARVVGVPAEGRSEDSPRIVGMLPPDPLWRFIAEHQGVIPFLRATLAITPDVEVESAADYLVYFSGAEGYSVVRAP